MNEELLQELHLNYGEDMGLQSYDDFVRVMAVPEAREEFFNAYNKDFSGLEGGLDQFSEVLGFNKDVDFEEFPEQDPPVPKPGQPVVDESLISPPAESTQQPSNIVTPDQKREMGTLAAKQAEEIGYKKPSASATKDETLEAKDKFYQAVEATSSAIKNLAESLDADLGMDWRRNLEAYNSRYMEIDAEIKELMKSQPQSVEEAEQLMQRVEVLATEADQIEESAGQITSHPSYEGLIKSITNTEQLQKDYKELFPFESEMNAAAEAKVAELDRRYQAAVENGDLSEKAKLWFDRNANGVKGALYNWFGDFQAVAATILDLTGQTKAARRTRYGDIGLSQIKSIEDYTTRTGSAFSGQPYERIIDGSELTGASDDVNVVFDEEGQPLYMRDKETGIISEFLPGQAEQIATPEVVERAAGMDNPFTEQDFSVSRTLNSARQSMLDFAAMIAASKGLVGVLGKSGQTGAAMAAVGGIGGFQAYGDSYNQLLKEGKTPMEAASIASAEATVIALTESMFGPLEAKLVTAGNKGIRAAQKVRTHRTKLLQNFAAGKISREDVLRGFGKQVKTTLKEVFGEVVEELVQETGAKYAEGIVMGTPTEPTSMQEAANIAATTIATVAIPGIISGANAYHTYGGDVNTTALYHASQSLDEYSDMLSSHVLQGNLSEQAAQRALSYAEYIASQVDTYGVDEDKKVAITGMIATKKSLQDKIAKSDNPNMSEKHQENINDLNEALAEIGEVDLDKLQSQDAATQEALNKREAKRIEASREEIKKLSEEDPTKGEKVSVRSSEEATEDKSGAEPKAGDTISYQKKTGGSKDLTWSEEKSGWVDENGRKQNKKVQEYASQQHKASNEEVETPAEPKGTDTPSTDTSGVPQDSEVVEKGQEEAGQVADFVEVSKAQQGDTKAQEKLKRYGVDWTKPLSPEDQRVAAKVDEFSAEKTRQTEVEDELKSELEAMQKIVSETTEDFSEDTGGVLKVLDAEANMESGAAVAKVFGYMGRVNEKQRKVFGEDRIEKVRKLHSEWRGLAQGLVPPARARRIEEARKQPEVSPEVKAPEIKGIAKKRTTKEERAEAWKEINDILNSGLGIAYDPKKEAEDSVKIVKALMKIAKTYIEDGYLAFKKAVGKNSTKSIPEKLLRKAFKGVKGRIEPEEDDVHRLGKTVYRYNGKVWSRISGPKDPLHTQKGITLSFGQSLIEYAAPRNKAQLEAALGTTFGFPPKIASMQAAIMDRIIKSTIPGTRTKKKVEEAYKNHIELLVAPPDMDLILRDENIRFDDTPIGRKNFQNWVGEAKVLTGYEIQDSKTGQPVVVKVYHGTTHEFYEFDSSTKGTVQGHFGRLNYFSSSFDDAGGNYGTQFGTDLAHRIENLAEELGNGFMENEFGNIEEGDIETLRARAYQIAEDYGLNPNDIEIKAEDANDIDGFSFRLAREIAKSELVGNVEQVMELWVKLNNPLVVGQGVTSWVDLYDVSEESLEEAAQEIAEMYEVTPEEAKEDYYVEVIDAALSLEGIEENPIVSALKKAMDESDIWEGSTGSNGIPEILEEAGAGVFEGEVDLSKLEAALRSTSLMYAHGNMDSKYYGPHLIAQMFKNLGYDGIIMTDPANRFRMDYIGRGDSHVHVFDEYANQIKLADGRNITFSDSKDIRLDEPQQPLVEQQRMTVEAAVSKNNGHPMSKAPNGKDSKLYQDILRLPEVNGDVKKADELKAQVYSDNFINWFGDWNNSRVNPKRVTLQRNNVSKVVDENGEPLMVYRGIKQEFADKDKMQYFAENRGYSAFFGNNIEPVFLDIKDMLDFEEYNKILSENGITAYANQGLLQISDELERERPYLAQLGRFYVEGPELKDLGEEFKDRLQSADGFTGYDAGYYGEEVVYVTRKPNQIKSVFNKGGFSPQDSRIRYDRDESRGKVPVTDHVRNANASNTQFEYQSSTSGAKTPPILPQIAKEYHERVSKGRLSDPAKEHNRKNQIYYDILAKYETNPTLKEYYQTYSELAAQGILFDRPTGDNLTREVSPTDNPKYSLKILQEDKRLQNVGEYVSTGVLREIANTKGQKPIVSQVLNEVLALPEFQRKRINYKDFLNEVSYRLFPLDVIQSESFSTYGAFGGLGFSPQNSKTHIYNSDIEHGITGHFSGDFPSPPKVPGKLKMTGSFSFYPTDGSRSHFTMIDLDTLETRDNNVSRGTIYAFYGNEAADAAFDATKENPLKVEVYQFSDVSNSPVVGVIEGQDPMPKLMEAIATRDDLYKTPVEIRPLKDKFAVVRSGVQLTQENIAENVFTVTETQEEAQHYIDNMAKVSVPKRGMFGHTRVWTNDDGGYYVAEIQSDTYQKQRAKDTLWTMYTNDPSSMTEEQQRLYEEYLVTKVDQKATGEARYDVERVLSMGHANTTVFLKVLTGDTTYSKINGVQYNAGLNLPTNTFSVERVGDNQFTYHIGDIEGNTLSSETSATRDQFIRDLLTPYTSNVDYSASYGEVEAAFKVLDKEAAKLKKARELKNKILNNTSLKHKQFLSHEKNHKERMLREEIARAAQAGFKSLYLPTTETLARIEGWWDAEGESQMPYEISSQRGTGEDLDEGDEIFYGGVEYTVVYASGYYIEVLESDTVEKINVDEELTHHAENDASDYISNIEYGINEEQFNDEVADNLPYNIDFSEVSNDEGLLDLDMLEQGLIDKFLDSHQEGYIAELYGYNKWAYLGDDITLFYDDGAHSITFDQPSEYEDQATEFDIGELGSGEAPARNHEKFLGKVRSMYDTNSHEVEGRGWIKITLTKEHADTPVVLFDAQEGRSAQPRGAYDISQRIMYALFNPAVLTPVHELLHGREKFLTPEQRLDVIEWVESLTDESYNKSNLDGFDYVFPPEVSEFFARGGEQFLKDGEAAKYNLTAPVRKLFEAFRQMLKDIYVVIKGINLEGKLNEQMKAVYNDIFDLETDGLKIPEYFSAKNSFVNELLTDVLGEELTPTKRVKWQETIQRAINHGYIDPEGQSTERIMDTVFRMMSGGDINFSHLPEIEAGMAWAAREISKMIDNIRSMSEIPGRSKIHLAELERKLSTISTAINFIGEITGRTLAFRRGLFKETDLTQEEYVENLNSSLNNKLSEENKKYIQQQFVEYERAKKELKELRGRAKKASDKKRIEEARAALKEANKPKGDRRTIKDRLLSFLPKINIRFDLPQERKMYFKALHDEVVSIYTSGEASTVEGVVKVLQKWAKENGREAPTFEDVVTALAIGGSRNISRAVENLLEQKREITKTKKKSERLMKLLGSINKGQRKNPKRYPRTVVDSIKKLTSELQGLLEKNNNLPEDVVDRAQHVLNFTEKLTKVLDHASEESDKALGVALESLEKSMKEMGFSGGTGDPRIDKYDQQIKELQQKMEDLKSGKTRPDSIIPDNGKGLYKGYTETDSKLAEKKLEVEEYKQALLSFAEMLMMEEDQTSLLFGHVKIENEKIIDLFERVYDVSDAFGVGAQKAIYKALKAMGREPEHWDFSKGNTRQKARQLLADLLASSRNWFSDVFINLLAMYDFSMMALQAGKFTMKAPFNMLYSALSQSVRGVSGGYQIPLGLEAESAARAFYDGLHAVFKIVAMSVPDMLLSRATGKDRSLDFSNQVYAQIVADPQVAMMMDIGGLEVTKPGTRTKLTEEFFRSGLVERIPFIGELSKTSNELFTTFNNIVRAYEAKKMLNILGGSITTEAQLKELGTLVNTLTGRGPLTSGSGLWLSRIFFAPKWLSSKLHYTFKYANPFFVTSQAIKAVKGDEMAAVHAAEGARMIAASAALVTMLAGMGFSIDLDCQDNEFLRIKLGTGRLDMGNMMAPYLKVLCKLANIHTADYNAAKKARKREFNPRDLVLEELLKGANPLVSIVFNSMLGKSIDPNADALSERYSLFRRDYFGKPHDPRDAQAFWTGIQQQLVPIAITNTAELIGGEKRSSERRGEEANFLHSAAIALMGFTGLGAFDFQNRLYHQVVVDAFKEIDYYPPPPAGKFYEFMKDFEGMYGKHAYDFFKKEYRSDVEDEFGRRVLEKIKKRGVDGLNAFELDELWADVKNDQTLKDRIMKDMEEFGFPAKMHYPGLSNISTETQVDDYLTTTNGGQNLKELLDKGYKVANSKIEGYNKENRKVYSIGEVKTQELYGKVYREFERSTNTKEFLKATEGMSDDDKAKAYNAMKTRITDVVEAQYLIDVLGDYAEDVEDLNSKVGDSKLFGDSEDSPLSYIRGVVDEEYPSLGKVRTYMYNNNLKVEAGRVYKWSDTTGWVIQN